MGHKTSHSKLKKKKMKSYKACFLTTIQWEINHKKNCIHTHTYTHTQNHMMLNNQYITEEVKEEIKKHLEKMKIKANNSKPMGYSKSSSKKEAYSNKILP